MTSYSQLTMEKSQSKEMEDENSTFLSKLLDTRGNNFYIACESCRDQYKVTYIENADTLRLKLEEILLL